MAASDDSPPRLLVSNTLNRFWSNSIGLGPHTLTTTDHHGAGRGSRTGLQDGAHRTHHAGGLEGWRAGCVKEVSGPGGGCRTLNEINVKQLNFQKTRWD